MEEIRLCKIKRNIAFVNVTPEIKNQINSRRRHPRHYLPPIDIGYSAALLESKDYKCSLLDTTLASFSYLEIMNSADLLLADIIVLRPNENAYDLTIKLANDLRDRIGSEVFLFVIGPVASMSVDYFMFPETPFDLCLIGEPEYGLVEALELLERGRHLRGIRGTAYVCDGKLRIEGKREAIVDLDSLPLPKHDFFLDKGYLFFYPVKGMIKKKVGFMLASRGCPHKCLFCSPIGRVSYGKTYRRRSVGNILKEICFLIDSGVNLIYFLDDIFNCDELFVEELCYQITKNNLRIRWAAQCRIDKITPKLLRLMRKSGCVCLNMGIESGSKRILKMFDKDMDLDEVLKKVCYCKSIGICTVGNFILGMVGELEQDREKTMEFIIKAKFNLVEVLFFNPYPGSRAFKKYGNNKDVDMYSRYEIVCGENRVMRKSTIKRFRSGIYRKFYISLRFIFNDGLNYIFSIALNGKNERVLFKKIVRYIMS